jgi:hypothetical protein
VVARGFGARCDGSGSTTPDGTNYLMQAVGVRKTADVVDDRELNCARRQSALR